MFFTLSKIFWALFTPLTVIGLILLAGAILLLLKREKAGRQMMVGGIALFLILGFLPIGPNLIVYLEKQYGKPRPMPESITGVVVLGGVIDGERSELYDQVSINERAERLTEMLHLSHEYPQARIIFSGGPGTGGPDSPKESEKVEKLLKDMGISTERFEFESGSRNTYENMIYSRDIAHPQAGDNWILITSAFHMPRSMAIFEKGGWPMTPYPAGYLEDGTYIYLPSLDLLGNFYKLQVATKEIVGIIAYGLTGKL